MVVRRASPHAGHDALVRLGEMYPGALTVVTQNVDGLHTRAGTRDVIELHGSLEAFRCSLCRDPIPLRGSCSSWKGVERSHPLSAANAVTLYDLG
jgi:NAD-dependent SIR2 family protein deacetylase